MNRLKKEKSAYLQHAAKHKIDWYPWSEEAFERAKTEDKPVFLSSGAIWCHWCHVMAKESFEDEEVAALLNEYFIAVKIDRDERPGFKSVLKAIGTMYQQKKEVVNESSQEILRHMKQESLAPGNLDVSMLEAAKKSILSGFDPIHGGFGGAPKFSMPGAMEFLMGRYSYDKDSALGNAIKTTLICMANGGIHDQLGGGFHRYSTDEAWIIPHFEKMADDNAWLLRNYVHAYGIFGDESFKEVSEGIIDFLLNELSYPDGGFYSSQDADITPDDEGGYFIWKNDDFRKILNDDEYRVLSPYLLHEKGAMRHDASKRVLYITEGIEEIAGKSGMDVEKANKIIDIGKTKLLLERKKREKPFVDKALYTSLNGMLISAFFEAYKAIKDEEIKEFALKSLEKILAVNFIDERLFHVEGVDALLDDYVNLVGAFIGAHGVTGDASYLNMADKFMRACIGKFWDNENNGFFDTEEDVIGTRLKVTEDAPHPSANSVGIMNLIKLSNMPGSEEYLNYAEKALKCFSLIAQPMGIHGGYYYCALDAFFHEGKGNIC
ncbi:MAG: thioredoxin domain-containing protein [Proteobacteria bacterium]|nr:thioredoxin domain-containing protein [Pseudomonadota bacterium]